MTDLVLKWEHMVRFVCQQEACVPCLFNCKYKSLSQAFVNSLTSQLYSIFLYIQESVSPIKIIVEIPLNKQISLIFHTKRKIFALIHDLC